MYLTRFCSFWIYPMLSLILLGVCVAFPEEVRWTTLLWTPLIGLVVWTFIEYMLHRFFFHWQPQSDRTQQILQRLHLDHHADPRNPNKILVRPSFSLPVSAVLLSIMYVLSGTLVAAVGMVIGIWAGFLYYESVHYRLHLSTANRGLLKYQRQSHFYHHFVDHHHCFGVTSPLWDLLFGTVRRVKSRRV